MLGKNADHFMRQQMHERVSAHSPNGGGRSFSPPDMERAGAPQVTLRGGMGVPGPQRAISGGSIPGMGFVRPSARPPMPRTSGALPGMGGVDRSGALPGMGGVDRSGALPGMGGVFGVDRSGALPGMGALDFTNPVTIGATLVAAYFGYAFLKKRKLI